MWTLNLNERIPFILNNEPIHESSDHVLFCSHLYRRNGWTTLIYEFQLLCIPPHEVIWSRRPVLFQHNATYPK